MIAFGTSDQRAARTLWEKLFSALSVSAEDDIWARWLQEEFERRRIAEVEWALVPFEGAAVFTYDELSTLRLPAKQFVADLDAVLGAKHAMTRRQWVSILESILRVGAVAHTLWVCELNQRAAELLRQALKGNEELTPAEIQKVLFAPSERPLVYGMPALPIIRERASQYLAARLYINLVLWHLEAAGTVLKPLSTLVDFCDLLKSVTRAKDHGLMVGLQQTYEVLSDTYSRDLLCRRGIGSNIVEFCRYTLGQRKTADDSLRGYDQGYALRPRGEYKSAPWHLTLGPVALLAFSHCCLAEAAGPRSVGRLTEHLWSYGLSVSQDDIVGSHLGKELRTLDLVLDSPDAESGMLLVQPFSSPTAVAGGAT